MKGLEELPVNLILLAIALGIIAIIIFLFVKGWGSLQINIMKGVKESLCNMFGLAKFILGC
ncbi:MAG: hypothetical protein QXD89_01105 [Candidatus Aenigmatarchaeota archaeon]